MRNWRDHKINLHVAYYSIHTANVVAVGGQARAMGAFDGCLTRKLAALVGELYPRHEKIIRSKQPETDIKLKF